MNESWRMDEPLHGRQSLKPPGNLRGGDHGRGREMEIVTGLFLEINHETRSLIPSLNVPPHFPNILALAPGWKGQCPWAARDRSCRVYHSVPDTVIKILAQKTSLHSCIGLQDNQSELLRSLNERQLEMKCHFITFTELPCLEPICC